MYNLVIIISGGFHRYFLLVYIHTYNKVVHIYSCKDTYICCYNSLGLLHCVLCVLIIYFWWLIIIVITTE